MKKIYLFLLVVAVSCNLVEVENGLSGIEPGGRMIKETISGSHGSNTKATIADADASFKWTVGDSLAVHVSSDASHKYVVTYSGASVADATAAFEVAYDEGYSRDAFAIFPSTIVAADAANYGQSGAALDVTLPDSYTLDQVTGETSPCPMIATNTPGTNWTFYQLCSLLRLTVNSIPASAKRLEIDFGGKSVSGYFSIPNPKGDGTSTIALDNASGSNASIIKITKDGTDVALGQENLVLNIPLPVGDYTNISVLAYDAITGGNVVHGGSVSFAYTAVNTMGTKRTAALSADSFFKFTFYNNGTKLGGLRFVRIFSCQNKLYNGSSSFGPFTTASATSLPDIDNPVETSLRFSPNPSDQLAFQVVGADGKVYSGIVDASAAGYEIGKSYDIRVDVNLYTFTVASGKKVYFSPGDLRVDNGVYSFSEPFDTKGWGGGTTTTDRVWFDYPEVNYRDTTTGHSIYGIKWRNPKGVSTTITPQEWGNIIGRNNMKSGVDAYYRVTASNLTYCLLLPPDETVLTNEEKAELEGGSVGNNYAKYLGKGFVLLIKTGRALYTTKLSWGMTSQGWYWAMWDNMGNNRTYFYWSDSITPTVSWAGNQFRMRVRYVRDVKE